MTMRLLVVEDERKVAGFIRKGLEAEGYAVDVAKDGDEALIHAHMHAYDCILLDRRLPRRSGMEVLRELRAAGRTTPVLMLTSLAATEDMVAGLDAGADDYLAKPFRFDELLARVRALVRRGSRQVAPATTLALDRLVLDRLAHRVNWDGEPLDLTAREFALLEHFLMSPGRVWKRMELLQQIWDMHFDPESNVVDVHVGNLRRKLTDASGQAWIETVRGVGYVLRVEGGD
jgi:DNA-binding response OmpR family regulator